MKNTILAFFLLFSCFVHYSFTQKTDGELENLEIKWMSFEEALKRCEKEPRKIVIDVYTNWCGWCKRMDATTFRDPNIVKYINEKFYAVKLNAETRDTIRFREKVFIYRPEKRANEIALALLNERMSYPTIVYLDETFSMLSPVPGFMDAKSIDMVLKFYGENKYKNESWEEFQKNYPPKKIPSSSK